MPIGYLQDQGLLNVNASTNTVPGVNGDAQAAANFFGDMCAANNNTNGPVFPPGVNYTARWPELCQACSVRTHRQHVVCCIPTGAVPDLLSSLHTFTDSDVFLLHPDWS